MAGKALGCNLCGPSRRRKRSDVMEKESKIGSVGIMKRINCTARTGRVDVDDVGKQIYGAGDTSS